MVLVAAVSMLLLAVPALAQQPDFYGGILPEEIERGDDGVVPPDGEVQPDGRAGAAGDRIQPRADARADRGERAAGDRGVTAAGRQLPVTGLGLAAGLFLALGLIGGGIAAVRLGRRRGHATQHSPTT